MTPCAGVWAQRARHLEIQRAGKFLFGTREILTAIEDDAAIEVGLAARQIPGRGKGGTAGQVGVRQRLLHPGRSFLGASPPSIRPARYLARARRNSACGLAESAWREASSVRMAPGRSPASKRAPPQSASAEAY